MLSRTLLSTIRLSHRSGQSATRAHLTAAWQAKSSSGIFQFSCPSRSRNATHRGWTSGGRGSFNAPRPPRFGFWQQISQRINRIPSNVIFWGILGINGVIFALWQVANTQYVRRVSLPGAQTLTYCLAILATIRRSVLTGAHVYAFHHERVEHEQWSNVCGTFTNSQILAINLLVHSWTLLTSSFSQRDVGHLLFNGISYYFTVPVILSVLGNTGFLALYLGAGLVASTSSLWWHSSVKQNPRYSSLGASGASRNSTFMKTPHRFVRFPPAWLGALYGVLSFFACLAPRATFLIFGIIPCPAWLCISGVFVWDGYSALTGSRQGTDTAGHIGGLLGGIGYYIFKMRFRI